MGACISRDSTGSKLELSDINSNVYRVVNVDDDGVALWSGQLGITRTELTLYRKGKDPTRWPLKCLRRYGYDADLFSFEAGRRCTTGEGIYAFRCRRAETLFQTLQSYIQLSTWSETNRGSISGTPNEGLHMPFNGAATGNGIGSGNYILANTLLHHQIGNGTIDSIDANYLEPIPNASSSHLGSVSRILSQDGNATRLGSVGSSGEPLSPSDSVDPHSPGSPNSINNILEVTSLNPLPTFNNGANCNGVSNIYQEFQFPLRGEGNNNKELKRLSLDIPPQEAAPSVRNMSMAAAGTPTTSANGYRISGLATANNNKRTIVAESPTTSLPLSPAMSPLTATIDGTDSSHMYMNISLGEMNAMNMNNKSALMNGVEGHQYPQSIRNNNNNHIFNKQYSNDSSHCYENLEPDDIRPFLQRQHLQQQQHPSHRRTSKSDNNTKLDYMAAVSSSSSSSIIIDKTSEPNTPTNPKFNYIVLDLDQSHNNSFNFNANSGYISPSRTIPSASITGATASITSTAGASATILNGGNANNATAMVAQTPTGIGNGSIFQPSATFTASTFNNLQLLPPESPKKGIFDYATIDFNKTVALSNSTTPSMDCEGSRKTRHSSSAMHSSINTPSHHNSVSD